MPRSLSFPPDLVRPVTSLGNDLVEGDGDRAQIRSSDGVSIELSQVVEGLELIAVADGNLKVLSRHVRLANACAIRSPTDQRAQSDERTQVKPTEVDLRFGIVLAGSRLKVSDALLRISGHAQSVS